MNIDIDMVKKSLLRCFLAFDFYLCKCYVGFDRL